MQAATPRPVRSGMSDMHLPHAFSQAEQLHWSQECLWLSRLLFKLIVVFVAVNIEQHLQKRRI